MTNWEHQLGIHLLNEGALTYIVSDDNQVSWDGKESIKQKVDMVAIFSNHIRLIELKEADSERKRGIKFQQIERYYYLCRDMKYNSEFWVYVYWHKYNIITGVKINKLENLNIYAIKENGLDFYASIGINSETRITKPVDIKIRLNNVSM